MVAEAAGSVFKRKDGKYFLYLPKHLVEDSAFPFKIESSVPVTVLIDQSAQRLIIRSETRSGRKEGKRPT